MEKMLRGNRWFIRNSDAALRHDLAVNGQHPFAVVICCSDSRVIPEAIFGTTFGELFVIRVAGNVLGDHQLGSIQYAVEHLGVRTVVMLGHTQCGAIGAALEGHVQGYVASVIGEIRLAIGPETDPGAAARLNVRHGVKRIREAFPDPDLDIRGAVYDIAGGTVEWL